MIPVSIPGYQVSEELYNGSRTVVYRAVREIDQKPVVIKLLKNPYPSFSELVQFRNQYTIAKNLNSPLIVQTYSLEPYQNGYTLVMEDFGGISLKEYFTNVETRYIASLDDFLPIAIALCNTLDILYRERIIHKDIKPSNILINPETKQIKLIDFSIASLLPRETQTLVNPNILEGTLAYISPEQTGRMNRGIDYRTDFYSLGVTFYELLTGELPFPSNEPMELVHCHIAKPAPNLRERVKEIPQVLCDLVSKLMAKNAEDRYQSAFGLKFDLENCLTQLQETGRIEDFEIGRRDVCDRFIIPDKLYGRETEVKILLQAFEKVSQGATEMMLVAGFSGIGKTAVVNEVHKPIVRQRGYFIKGKYDQFQRNIPLSAFVQAFQDLMSQLLTESDAEIEQWKNKILANVGENGQVIIEVIPELEKIIGKQPPAAELSGTAAQNRFNLLLQKFTQVFTSASHPLVMFLDDLQWADATSLKLIQLLMADTSHFLLIGAYRDHEVYPVHPLILTLNEIAQSSATMNTITLAALSQITVNQLVADTLKCPEELAWNLSVLIYQKTQGNPFFTTQFLKALHQESLIKFDCELSCWQCDITQITIQAVTDDVVAFMSWQLQKLPLSTQQMLQLAACIGNQFDLATLAIVSQKSQIEAAAYLWRALQEGLILPINDVYKFYQDSLFGDGLQQRNNDRAKITAAYKFLHDRVQQAAYSLIPEAQKQATHYQIGQLLLQNISTSEQEARIFEIVNQINVGVELIEQPREKEELAKLNLIAGRKAKNSTAYGVSVKYFTIGRNLLASDRWNNQYNLTLSLYMEAMEAAYLNTDIDEMETLAQVILQQAKTPLDTVKVYVTRIMAYTSQSQLLLAISTGLTILKQLEIDLPESPTLEDIARIGQETQTLLGSRKPTDLLNLPEMKNPQMLAVMEILNQISVPAYLAKPHLNSLIIMTQMNLSMSYGNAPISALGYASYGLFLCAVAGDLVQGYEFGELALNLLSKFQEKKIEARVLFVASTFIVHWKIHARETLQMLQNAYYSGWESGSLMDLGYAAYGYGFHAYFMGNELSQLEQEMTDYSKVLEQLNQQTQLNYNEILRQTILNLLAQTDSPLMLFGGQIKEQELLARYQRANDKTWLWHFFVNKLILCYLFAEFQQAFEHIASAKIYLDGGKGMFNIPVFYLYAALTWLAVFPHLSQSEQENILAQVTANQKSMQSWTSHNPTNHLHKYYLVEAEKHRVLGQHLEAINAYDLAISLAQENGYIQEEGLANELAGKFCLEWGKQKFAAGYMQQAYYCYAKWGAKAKVADLEKRYPQLLAPILQQTHSSLSTDETIFALGTLTSSLSLTSSSNISNTLDLAAILKASHSISGEIELQKLLSSLLSIVIENAGADKCVLMLLRDNRLLIKGSIIQGTQPVVLQRIPVEDSQDIPLKLIHKVKHNNQTVVLLDAMVDPILANDPYMIRQQPKSILCSPILHQSKLMGILYLENNLAKGAFTSERIELLNLLCAQAAISLENARLYERSQEYAQQLEQALDNLQNAQLQIVQSEKMSALGNLVAGVAHEMNNPLGFIAASLQQAQPTIADITEHLKLYQKTFPNNSEEIINHAESIDLDYSLEDLPKMIDSMLMACDRLKNISTSLRTFSRTDRDYKVAFNIHEGIDSTILILKHRLKPNEQRPAIEVVTNYGNLPQVECFPGQLNQVFMNLLANAIDALDESNQGRSFEEIKANPNRITITTSFENNLVKITIMDNGKGMSESVKQKIFDHLFTTKAVGKGTGLGLAIAQQIVEETHNGKLSFNSVLGKGTDFFIEIPV